MPCYTKPRPCVSEKDCEKFVAQGACKIISLYDTVFYRRNKDVFQNYKAYSKNKDTQTLSEKLFNYAKRYPVTPLKMVFYYFIKSLPKVA